MRSRVLGRDLEKVLPIEFEGLSDSAALDQVLSLLVHSGRSLPHALMMMVPEAYEGDRFLQPARRAFYQYHSGLIEPWDGPASLVFCDGVRICAMLDRNGLRPSRYVLTHDNLLVLASESGVLPFPPEQVRTRGRLQPGKILLADLSQNRIIGDLELKDAICRAQPYGLWLEKYQIGLADLPEPAQVPEPSLATLLARQQAFGYTQEDVYRVLLPMAQDGKEPVSSTGSDTPLAVLSRRSQILPSYFKQLFAQVTNPPIDPIREQVVMSTESLLGAGSTSSTKRPSMPGSCG